MTKKFMKEFDRFLKFMVTELTWKQKFIETCNKNRIENIEQ